MIKQYDSDAIDWNKVFSAKNLFLTVFGVALAVLAMKGFMIPNRFMDGGITGNSILIHEIFHFNISLLGIVFNAPLVYMGYKRIGATFATQTSIAILLLALGLYFIDIEPITTDKLLIAIFGGVLIGTGIGLVIRAGAVVDGAEVVAVFTKRKTGFSNSEIIIAFNTLIFAVAAFQFGIETAMYSLITYFAATRATDYVVDGIEQYTAMNIISSRQDEIKDLLVNQFEKGITVYEGERGYLPGSYDIKADCQIIVTVITRLEIVQIQDAVMKVDPQAFVYIQTIREATGGVLKAKAHAK